MNTTGPSEGTDAGTEASAASRRAEARKRLEARREFGSHFVAYVVINAFLIMAWAVTGAGYFWPVWVLAGWGAGLALHAWDAFVRRPIRETDIDAELRRQSG
jgi:hypothetical protein